MEKEMIKTAEVGAGVFILLIGLVVFTTALSGTITGASITGMLTLIPEHPIPPSIVEYPSLPEPLEDEEQKCFFNKDCQNNYCHNPFPFMFFARTVCS